MNNWLAVGPPENWEIALKQGNIWGIPSRYEKLWVSIAKGDLLFFYATHPAKGVIGYGKIISTFRENKPLWPQEKEEGRSLWPLRIKFEIVSCLPIEEWPQKAIRLSRQRVMLRRAFQRLKDEVAKEIEQAL
jgi:hypothetical protein